MSFILSFENWEFLGYVEIIRKFFVLISNMKKKLGLDLKMFFICSLLYFRVVFMFLIALFVI